MDRLSEGILELDSIDSISIDNENSAEYVKLTSKARKNDSYAYLQLASWHVSNAQNVRDYVKAYGYAKRAASHGYYEAYYILGQLLFYGTGCEKNVVRATRYLKYFIDKSAAKGNTTSQCIADSYYKLVKGFYELKDYKKAIAAYNKLCNIDIELADKVSDLEKNIKYETSETKINIVKYTILSLSFFAAAYFLVVSFKQQFYDFMSVPSKEVVSVVANVDISSASHGTKDIIPEDTPLSNTNVEAFYLLSKDAFFEKELNQVNPIEVYASSEYISSIGADYSSRCMLDGDENTTWQEGEAGPGIGVSLKFSFPNRVKLRGFIINNGKTVNKDSYLENNRVQSFVINYGDEISVKLEDKYGQQYVFFSKPIESSSFEFILDEVYYGTIYNDTCITDIEFYTE